MILSPPSESIHLRFLVKLLAQVSPSPVGPAMVIVVWPSPPIPIPLKVAPFFVYMVVSIYFTNTVI